VSKARNDRDAGAPPMPAGAQVHRLTEDLALLSFPLAAIELPPNALSPAEEEVALLVYAGASNKEIARARGVSPRTVGNQLESIYRKLGVGSRAELVLRLGGAL
jgi:DNA-binding CsgD family transcriptional regulator